MSDSANTGKTIALMGVNLGNGNLGEEITAAAVIANIKSRHPDINVIEFSSNPGDTKVRLGVEALPINIRAEQRTSGLVKSNYHIDSKPKPVENNNPLFVKVIKKIARVILLPVTFLLAGISKTREFFRELAFIRRCSQRLAKVDLLVFAGSGPFADNFGGAFSYPFLIARWVWMAKRNKVPVAFFAVGAVPFSSSLSATFIRYAVRNSAYSSFRDNTSYNIVKGLGFNNPGEVFPDIAFSYPVSLSRETTDTKKAVGISLFPHHDPRYWPEEDLGKYREYVTHMAGFCTGLTEKKIVVTFISSQIRSDVLVTNDVINEMEKLGVNNDYISCPVVETHVQFINEVNKVELMVATRFHGMVMSLICRKPVVGLANQQKMVDLMIDMGQEELLLEIENMTADELQRKFEFALENKDQLIDKLNVVCEKNSERLAAGYESLLSIN